MKRSAAIPILTLGLVCAAPVGYVLYKDGGISAPATHNFAAETGDSHEGRSVLAEAAPEPEAAAPDAPATAAKPKAVPRGEPKPDTPGFLAGLLDGAMKAIESAPTAPSPVAPRAVRTVHEPRLSIYDTPRSCAADNQDAEMCRAAYRDARRQSERSSDIFEDLDACEHRYGHRACYERRLNNDLTIGESLYMPIMAGFAMVTDGRQMLARPVYNCPTQITNGRSCHQTETGMVMRDRDNNQPIALADFEQDYTGYILRQTVRETEMRNGRAVVYIRTAAFEPPRRPQPNAKDRRP
jgi:hypothetical protein